VDEHIFATVIAHDEAETLLTIEEFYDAFAFSNDLGRHAAATTAATAETTTAAAAETAAAATAETTAAAAASFTKAATATAAETATITKATAISESAAAAAKTAALIGIEILVAETVPLVFAASTAAPVKTHALLVTFASPTNQDPDEHVGRRTCRIRRKTTVGITIAKNLSKCE
jgi:hypothetical protein